MRHIKNYKLFESIKKLTYETIGNREMFPEAFNGDDLNDKKIDNVVLSKIIEQFPGLAVGRPNNYYIHRVKSTTFIDHNHIFDFDISEVEDEWFYIALHLPDAAQFSDYINYKCDQLEGVFDLLRDVYSKFE